MKIAIIHGPFCLGGGANGFDIQRLYSDSRGLSGSDLGVFRMAQELALQDCWESSTIYTYPKPGTTLPQELCPGVKLRHYDDRFEVSHTNGFGAAVSWNEAEPLMGLDCLTAVSLQINSLVGSTESIRNADMWLSPSASHRTMMLGDEQSPRTHMVGNFWHPDPYVPNALKWFVVPDGCDLETYDRLRVEGHQKVQGRAIWCSSPDRGLHWLLSVWPLIRKAVPHAELRIFYRLKPWLDHMLHQDPIESDASIQEQISRANYISDMLERFGPSDGIHLFDSVGRRRIVEEQVAAACLPYSCDPPGIWTEGFSCSAMECCAAGTTPILPLTDAFPEIYGDLDLVPRPSPETIDRFAQQVIRVMRDHRYRQDQNEIARCIAERYTWRLAASQMTEVLRPFL